MNQHTQEEGVIKFDLQFTPTGPIPSNNLEELFQWRSILWQFNLIGQDPNRYDGYGFGNVSQRVAPDINQNDKRSFVISGTQTGHLEALDNCHFAVVSAYDTNTNLVVASGPLKPSSEALTHAMIYDLDDKVQAVLHVHSPDIWKTSSVNNIPVTDVSIEYGTPDMAQEVLRLFTETNVRHTRIFSMGGHKDGVVAFGDSVEQAGQVLLQSLATCS